MSFETDPQCPWRVKALSDVQLTIIKFDKAEYGEQEDTARTDTGSGPSQVASWFEANAPFSVDDDSAKTGFHSNKLRVAYDVANRASNAGVDGVVSRKFDLSYDYRTPDTILEVSNDWKTMVVQPELAEHAVASMTYDQSVEGFAKAAGFKLPRVTSKDATPSVMAVPEKDTTMLINRLESLRGTARKHATQDDYGLRLHNLARIVCHAHVVAGAGLDPRATEMMSQRSSNSVLTAELPLISVAELYGSSWWYVGTDASAPFRAFLTMGARGLQHFASRGCETIYSRAMSEPEVSGGGRIAFVRLSGEYPSNIIPAYEFTNLLARPEVCLAYYYAYAANIGLGHEATEVLMQTAVGPHLWGERARLPYKPTYPRLDACAYLFAEKRGTDRPTAAEFKSVVNSACVIGTKLLVGLGAVITGFGTSAKTAGADVLSQVVGLLSNADQTRTLMREVCTCMSAGNVGLEWLDPFRLGVGEGFERCVEAFRKSGSLLSQYRRVPISALRGVFSGGVDMQDAVIGSRTVGGDKYRELLIFQLAAGLPLSMKSEKFSQHSMPSGEYTRMGSMRAWVAVCRWVRYGAVLPKPSSGSHRSVSSNDTTRSMSPTPSLNFIQGLAGSEAASTVSLQRSNARSGSHSRTRSSQGGGSVGESTVKQTKGSPARTDTASVRNLKM